VARSDVRIQKHGWVLRCAASGGLTLSSFNTLKTIKITLASLFAVALTGLASAQTPVSLHVTGSTAYRAATLVAISEILQPGYSVGYVASAPEAYTSANMVVFSGTTNSGVSVVIQTAFFGSIGGVCNVAGGLTIGPGGTAYTDGQTIGWLSAISTQLASASVTFSGGVYSVQGGQQVAAANATFDAAAVPDLTMSDSFQKAAPTTYQKPVLSGEIVGVVPFVWICAPGTTASTGTVTKLTSANAIKAFKGTLLLSNLSGKKGDKGVNVYLVGRDQDSGTRVAAITDTGFGNEKKGTIYNDVMQYQPEFDGNPVAVPPPTPSSPITGAALWPATTSVDSIASPLGDSGYNSGSLVGKALLQTSNYSNWFVGYVGLNDGVTALGNASNFVLEFNTGSLTYSGGSWDVSGVEDGSYTFWGYEHLLYLSSLTGSQLALAQEIGTEILTATAPVSGVEVSDMTVHREYDGGAILSGGNPPNSP
jgi:hypothetical protein